MKRVRNENRKSVDIGQNNDIITFHNRSNFGRDLRRTRSRTDGELSLVREQSGFYRA